MEPFDKLSSNQGLSLSKPGKWKLPYRVLPLIKYKIYGNSMSPTLNSGDVVLASPLPYLFSNPKIGDIVVCSDPRDKKMLVKRLIKVESQRYFVAGDNKKASTDSKNFGFIKRRDIISKVIYSSNK